MLAKSLVVYSIRSPRAYALYFVSLITNNVCFITVLFICQINHYHTIATYAAQELLTSALEQKYVSINLSLLLFLFNSRNI